MHIYMSKTIVYCPFWGRGRSQKAIETMSLFNHKLFVWACDVTHDFSWPLLLPNNLLSLAISVKYKKILSPIITFLYALHVNILFYIFVGVTVLGGKFPPPTVFFHHFMKGSEPLHMSGVLNETNYPAFNKWTDDYLRFELLKYTV